MRTWTSANDHADPLVASDQSRLVPPKLARGRPKIAL
jgi:hypothetical protein